MGYLALMASALQLEATPHPGMLMALAVVQEVALALVHLLVSQLADLARSWTRMPIGFHLVQPALWSRLKLLVQLGSDSVQSVLRAQL